VPFDVPAGPLFSQLPVLRCFLRELKPQLGSAAVSAALAAAEELAELGKLLQAWGLAPGQLLLEPLLTPHSEHFSGVLFQVGWRCCLLMRMPLGLCELVRVWLPCIPADDRSVLLSLLCAFLLACSFACSLALWGMWWCNMPWDVTCSVSTTLQCYQAAGTSHLAFAGDSRKTLH
jgi:hypothetical protein